MSDGTMHIAMIDKAKAIVGENPHGNLHLECAGGGRVHIDRLHKNAPDDSATAALIEILQSQPLKFLFRDYENNDKRSIESQSRFVWARVWAILPLALAIILAVCGFLVPSLTISKWLAGHVVQNQKPEILDAWLHHAVPLLVYLGLLLAPIIAWRQRPNFHYEAWMKSRALAEALRRELFTRVLNATPSTKADDRELLLLKFEYFRRYQIDLQAAYFHRQLTRYQKMITRTKWLFTAYVVAALVWGLLIVLTLISGVEEQGVMPVPEIAAPAVSYILSWLQRVEMSGLDFWMLIGSVVIAAVYGLQLFYSVLLSSARNAARFGPMQENFARITAQLADVRKAASEGKIDDVERFMRTVHSTMSAELADWVRLADLERDRAAKPGAQPSAASIL